MTSQNPPGRISDEFRCTAQNTKGERCGAARQVGSDVCVAHDPAARQRYGVGGAQPGSGPKPLPKPIDVIRQRLEDDADRYLAPLERALDGDDVGLALRAMAEALDRVYGKPRQYAEVAHSGGLSIEALFVQDPLAETHTPLPEDQS
jgi:hypothetical protein